MQDPLQSCVYFTIFPSLPLIFPEPSPGRLMSLSITERALLRVTEGLCVTRFNGLSLPLAGSPPQQCWTQMTLLPQTLGSEHQPMASYSGFPPPHWPVPLFPSLASLLNVVGSQSSRYTLIQSQDLTTTHVLMIHILLSFSLSLLLSTQVPF